jgi:hypothetical protein
MLQRLKSLLDQLPPKLFLIFVRETCVPDHVNDTVPEHQPIGSDHLRNRQRRRDLHGRNARLFQFSRDRSAAARARSSRRCEDYGIDSETFDPLGHFPTHATRIGQRVGQP